MNIGYIRISAKDQNPQRQIEPIQNLTERVYIDKVTGRNANRPQLKEMLLFARKGDLIITESISRFARNTKDLLELIELLNKKEIGFKSLKENIDTTTPQGKFMVTVFGAVAELEVEYTRERQREGIDIALRDKRAYGRPKSLSDEEIEAAYQEYKSSNYTKGIYERLGVSKATFYRLMKEWEGKIII